MTNHDFITLSVQDKEMDAYIALPEGEGTFPAIIVLQEAFGVNQHIRNVAERFCKEGYAVIAPDLFYRTAKRLEVSYSDFASVKPHFAAITNEGLEADLTACYNWLEQQQNIDHDKTGSVGYCLGGRVSFLANTVLPLAAGVSYYGGGVDSLADRAVNLNSPHLFFWGGKDTHIQQENIDRIINAVRSAGKDYISTVISYADHGFNCDERSSYHPLAAKEAWATTLQFFENRLKS
jgi:carboxymethylenebutenolidase